MMIFNRLTNLKVSISIPKGQKFRYLLIAVSCALFFTPLAILPGLADSKDLCGPLCMRRFYLWFPGMEAADLIAQVKVAFIGATALGFILLVTLLFGRIWCAYICPVGGFSELVSRIFGERWKIEYRWMPQIQLRYGYFLTYVFLLPVTGISACNICNFITVPRIFQALNGDWQGLAYLVSTIGLMNLALLFLLGFFANKGRAYCQFLCPIGAIDALVNRLGATFRFTRRIRVARERCTGCNICAQKCMCGAIRMVDKIAVVDQLSCMSCHECADVCDWGAIDWLAVPPKIEHGRFKKGVDYRPLPEWVGIYSIKPKEKRKEKRMLWRVAALSGVAIAGGVLLLSNIAEAAPRQADPDGCLSCHGLPGLNYIDENGIERNITINTVHYLSSLHGSVGCRDCHSQIRYFPHEKKNAGVDCTAECHLDEPSKGEAYTHKPVAEEMERSVHKEGASKGFTGGNRLQESRDELHPSCRRCHSNTEYITAGDLPKFAELFEHTDKQCGNCHQGTAWRNRFAGHVLRRFMTGRWSKQEGNAICKGCHADEKMMQKVERKAARKTPEPASLRFIQATATYDATLHGRLITVGRDSGAACIDCHAPAGLRHAIEADEVETAPTHPDNLVKTCGAENCHGYADDSANSGFLETDMHDLDWAPMIPWRGWDKLLRMDSPWVKAMLVLSAPVAFMLLVMVLGWLFGKKQKGAVYSIFGGQRFKFTMLTFAEQKDNRRNGKKGNANG